MIATFKKPIVWIPTVAVLVVALTVGLYLFQPWKLFVNQQVDEAFPVASAPATPVPSASQTAPPASPTAPPASESGSPSPTESPAPAEPVILAEGSFISHEHSTTGRALVVELPDGSRVLRIEDLDTSNGPDLKVWLTDAPVIEGTDGWFVFDDGAYVDLGALKGNQGNANYPIPDDVDLTDLTSISIWCDRFSVSFGAAELQPV